MQSSHTQKAQKAEAALRKEQDLAAAAAWVKINGIDPATGFIRYKRQGSYSNLMSGITRTVWFDFEENVISVRESKL
jgi:hypothetical protein